MNDSNISVGAIIKRDGMYFLIDRKNFPIGWASVAGHVKQGQTVEAALYEEVNEEARLTITSYKKLFEETVLWDDCGRHAGHHWYVFEVETKGDPVLCESEAKSMGWFSPEQMKAMNMERAWKYFFERIEVLK